MPKLIEFKGGPLDGQMELYDFEVKRIVAFERNPNWYNKSPAQKIIEPMFREVVYVPLPANSDIFVVETA